MADFRVEVHKLTDADPDPENANLHTARGQQIVEESLRKRGAFRSLAAFGKGVARPVIGAGNLTQETAIGIGMDEAIFVYSDGSKPIVHVRTDIAPGSKEARKLALEDNRAAEVSLNWDVGVVAGFDADVIAGLWSPAELSTLGQQWADEHDEDPPEDPGAQVDKAEELQQKWNVQPGDVWTAGAHRLICGDCREPETWGRLLDGATVNGVFTSPPYAEQRKAQYGGVPTAEYVDWWDAVQGNVKAHLAADGSFFVNIKPHCEDGERVLYVFDLVLAMQRRWGWRFVDELCWTHPGVPGAWPNRFKNSFEPIYQFAISENIRFRPDDVKHTSDDVFSYSASNPKAQSQSGLLSRSGVEGFTGMARPGNVINASTGGGVTDDTHAAAFPVALPDFFIRAYSDAGDVWLDPFLGSGTTIVAAHQNKRVGMGIEQLPKYVAVCCERLAGLGLTPTRKA